MSYIRFGSPFQYVEGESKDYVFETDGEIEDYGGMETETIVEIMMRIGKKTDSLILTHMAKQLARKYAIELRPEEETTDTAYFDRVVKDCGVKNGK